jgi:MFS superfamily sulfate permease-like transporter
MSLFLSLFVAAIVLVFWGAALAVLVAAAISMWLMLFDELKSRRKNDKA